ncbi:hypothetical protein [Desulfosporosinus sp. SB140]|uniref:hypothetical protein n=1 Tax=Desulfosporosinus paludis TaxID=3115649 RepID=UPI00388F8A3C
MFRIMAALRRPFYLGVDMSVCLYFLPNKIGHHDNCANCRRWNGTRCQIERPWIKPYEDSEEFDFYDRLMRDNKPVAGPL